MIVEVDFSKDVQSNYTLYTIIAHLRKSLSSLPCQSPHFLAGLDALKRNLEKISFDHLLEELKGGIRKMMKAYKSVEIGQDKKPYSDVSKGFIEIFNGKIGDFASEGKEDSVRSQQILVDALDFLFVSMVEAQFLDKDLRNQISNDIELFPNLFSPLFNMYSTSLISIKTNNISKMLKFPSQLTEKEHGEIETQFLLRQKSFMSEFPLICCLILDTLQVYAKFSVFYESNQIPTKVPFKKLSEFKQLSTCGEDLLKLVKLNRNISKFHEKGIFEFFPVFAVLKEF